jgi:hypothetical protein
MARFLVFLLATSGLLAQTAPPDLDNLLRDVRTSIGNGDLVTATDLTVSLDEGVQTRLRTWMLRDVRQRVAELLTWLPAATETLLVDQQPFVMGTTAGRPDLPYLSGRLSLVRALRGRTVRLAAASEMRIRDRPGIPLTIPAAVPDAGIVYYYFLTENFDAGTLGPREQDSPGRAVWRLTARPQTRDDETWITLARPDVLVTSNSRELLADVMDRILKGSTARALPTSLQEWTEVDRNAPFWGLRHYSDPGERHDAGNPRTPGSRLFQSDPTATGLTVSFDPTRQTLDIRYLSRAERLGNYIEQMFNRQLQVDRSRPGVWVLKSNLREQGEFPFHLAMAMLGFGSSE